MATIVKRIDPATLNLKEQVVAINRVTKVVKGGKNLSFSALVVIGDPQAKVVGYGVGKAKEVPSAIRKGIEAAKKNLRLLLTGGLPDPAAEGLAVRTVAGGFLVQSRDAAVLAETQLKTVTRRAPTAAELEDLEFAWRVCKHVKSNAIVYAKDGASVGIGAGQMSRVDAARIAAWKAVEAAKAAGLDESLAKGAVVASDAFFPFPDGLLAAIEAGATAVIQPGGSLRDKDVIAAADEAGIAMVFTGVRHFRH